MNIDQLIMGGLLGDSCIPKLEKLAKNNRLHFAHSQNQKCYAEMKADLFKEYKTNLGIKHNVIKSDRYKTGKIEEYRFRTKSAPIFNYYRNLFYPDGKKIVPKEIENLTEEGLAIWFLDDGYRTGNNTKGIAFSTEGFDKESIERLKTLLTNKFGLKCSIHSRNIIYIWVKSVPKLMKLISPFVPECMRYKMNGSCINRVNCKKEENLICSQASNALEEGSTTTGGVGSLNNQQERPTPIKVMT
jgi:hypothetical protein